MESETESKLVERTRGGDEAALLQLVEAYAPRVLRFGRKLCGDDQDAQEVVQQTLLTATSRIGEFRGES
ncbi:MAG TPA: sigma factor [Polyangiaceae bacterium]|nr:sigma factor [Polyangiaceae bacterium]